MLHCLWLQRRLHSLRVRNPTSGRKVREGRSVGVKFTWRKYALSRARSSLFRMTYFEYLKQESRAVARKPRDATAVLFGLKFVDNDERQTNDKRRI